MRSHPFYGLALLAVVSICLFTHPLFGEKGPLVFDGYVTNIASATEFDVGSRHVVWDDKTTWQRNSNLPEFLTELRVGVPVHVDGEFRDLHGKRTFVATNVHPNPTLKSAPDGEMQGRGLIYQAPALRHDAAGWTGTLWVDGYPLHITPRTKVLAADGSLMEPDKLQPNQWASYEAIRRSESDSTILATSITIEPNVVDDGEKKFRDKAAPKVFELDPAKQSPVSFSLGVPFAIIHLDPIQDPQLQAYVSNVGNSLIPRYQKDLPDDDPTKINFRFHVFRHPSKWKGSFQDALAYPGGLVLLPDNVLAALTNEAQLAALLSDCIAAAIEKDMYLHRTRLRIQGGADIGSNIAGIFTATALPITIGNDISLANLIRDMHQRAARIGLTYMLAAGYDIREAPFAWTIAENGEVRNPMKAGVPAPTMASTLMESLQLDYATIDYSTLKTNREAFAAMQTRLRAADDELPKQKNHGD